MRKSSADFKSLRPVSFTANFTDYAEGSVLICSGNTRLICNATVEKVIPTWMVSQNIEGGWITAEYGMLPRSTHTRISRQRAQGSGRTEEISRLIGRSLRAGINLKKLGPITITLDCDVVQADGGTRTAAITGGFTALSLAKKNLESKSILPDGTSYTDIVLNQVAAVSAGIVSGNALLDLCYEEDSQADVDGNFVMDSEGKFIEIQLTGERSTFSLSQMTEMIELASHGINNLFSKQVECINSVYPTQT